MRKVVFALLAVAALASVVNADSLTLFYDARSTAAAINTPAPPYTNSASLCLYAPYGIGQNYPLYATGHAGDGQMVWVSPKIGDLVNYYGQTIPDGIPDEQCVWNNYNYSLNSFYLYANFVGQAGAVISSIGVDQAIPGAFSAGADPQFFLQSATTTLVNTSLWSPSGTSVTGNNALTTLKMVQVPVKAGTAGPEFDTTVGLRANSGITQIAKVDLVGAMRPHRTVPPPAKVGIYNVSLTENALKVTSCAAVAPPALTKYFGYWHGAPDTGSNPDMVIYVVCKGDFDLDGTGATTLDNFAYYDISAYATQTNFNPFEQWLGDFDGDGQPATTIDNIDYFRYANIPAP